MTIDDARALAENEIAVATQMNASAEHAETAKRARLAYVILDLANQLETAQRTIGEKEAESKPKGKSK